MASGLGRSAPTAAEAEVRSEGLESDVAISRSRLFLVGDQGAEPLHASGQV